MDEVCEWEVPDCAKEDVECALRKSIKGFKADLEKTKNDAPKFALRHNAVNLRGRVDGAGSIALRIKTTILDVIARGFELAPESIDSKRFKNLDMAPETMETIRAVYSTKTEGELCKLARSLVTILRGKAELKDFAQVVVEELMSVMEISREEVAAKGTKKVFVICKVRGEIWYEYAENPHYACYSDGDVRSQVRKALRGSLIKHFSDLG